MQTHTLVATLNGIRWTWEVEMEGPPLVVEAARKGFQEWLQDASSTAKPGNAEETASAATRKAAVQARYDKIVSGTYQPGRGGGGRSRLTIKERAVREVLTHWARTQGGMKAVVAQKWAKTPSTAWQDITRRAVLTEVQAAGMNENEVRALDLDNVIAANLDVVKASFADAILEKERLLRQAAGATQQAVIKGIVLSAPPSAAAAESQEFAETADVAAALADELPGDAVIYDGVRYIDTGDSLIAEPGWGNTPNTVTEEELAQLFRDADARDRAQDLDGPGTDEEIMQLLLGADADDREQD